MGSLIKDLPVRPAHLGSPNTVEEILEQPDIKKRLDKLTVDIKDQTFKDIDPGVFDHELVKQNIWYKLDPKHPEKAPVDQNGNIVTGTYPGTQAAVTHVYNRIERAFESYFDILQIEPTLPRAIELAQKQKIYQWSPYPMENGKPAQYPPHLEVIPKQDQVSELKIFNALGLAETAVMIQKVVPDTFIGKTADWLLSVADEIIGGTPENGPTIQDMEEYNMKHRKSGTDIEQGNNIGMLPDWYSDRRFADQAFTGTNPTTITAVPQDLLQEFIETAKRDGWDYWAKSLPTVDAKTLYVQDVRGFRASIGAGPSETLWNREPASSDNWACAAVTLFQLFADGSLHPVAIVCDYKGSMADSVTIFNQRHTPTDPTVGEAEDWPWRYAKTCAQVTDWTRHEVGVHLTHAHLIEEAIIVATNRTISMEHPVFQLLQPHWYKTLSLNAAARETLVPQIIKDLVGLKPDQLYAYVRHEYESFDYVQRYVPNDLAARGFPNTAEGLRDPKYRNYAYAKNLLSMWDVIRKYVMDMLHATYVKDEAKADEQVRDDMEIQNWCREVQTSGHIKTFPTIQTLDQLADAVTMSIHIAAPFHSAVNYLQNFYQAFVIAKPPSLCAPPPSTLAELRAYTQQKLVDALPIRRQRQWLLSAQVPWLLSFKVASDRSLISFALSQWRTRRADQDRDDTGKIVQDISERFYIDLRKLAVEFAKTSRGMSEGSIPYLVTDPDNTAVSILI